LVNYRQVERQSRLWYQSICIEKRLQYIYDAANITGYVSGLMSSGHVDRRSLRVSAACSMSQIHV